MSEETKTPPTEEPPKKRRIRKPKVETVVETTIEAEAPKYKELPDGYREKMHTWVEFEEYVEDADPPMVTKQRVLTIKLYNRMKAKWDQYTQHYSLKKLENMDLVGTRYNIRRI